MTNLQSIFLALKSAIENRLAALSGLTIDVAVASDTAGFEPGVASNDATVLMLVPEVDSWDSHSMDVNASYHVVILTRVDSGIPNVFVETEIIGAIAAATTDIAQECVSSSIGIVSVNFNGRERIATYKIAMSWNGMP